MARTVEQIDFLLAGLTDANGDMLAGGKVYTYAAGTTTEQSVYTDPQGTTPATNPVILDVFGRATVYGVGNYKFVIKDSNDATITTLDNLYYGVTADPSTVWGGTSTGAANTFEVTTNPISTSFNVGDEVKFIAHQGATAASTFNPNGTGAKAIKNTDGSDISVTKPIVQDTIYVVVWDGTNWVLTNHQSVNGSEITANTITSTQLAADSVTATEIAAGAVGNSELATDAVTADKIAAGAVGNSELATDAVTADKIAAGAVGTSEIATNAVTANEIAYATITGNEIQSGAINSNHLTTQTASLEFSSAFTFPFPSSYDFSRSSSGTLTTTITRVTVTVSLTLPAGTKGRVLYVQNAALSSVSVSPSGSDQINSKGSGVSISIPSGGGGVFFCVASGQWAYVGSGG